VRAVGTVLVFATLHAAQGRTNPAVALRAIVIFLALDAVGHEADALLGIARVLALVVPTAAGAHALRKIAKPPGAVPILGAAGTATPRHDVALQVAETLILSRALQANLQVGRAVFLALTIRVRLARLTRVEDAAAQASQSARALAAAAPETDAASHSSRTTAAAAPIPAEVNSSASARKSCLQRSGLAGPT
jgi:hypothetical protein